MKKKKKIPKPPTPAVLHSRTGIPADCKRNSFAGAGVFLLAGGPSLQKMNLELLRQPGITTASMNNVATFFRTDLWFSVDTTSNFSERIWRDPNIMKFTKFKLMREHLHVFRGNDKVALDVRINKMPNVWGFNHIATYDKDRFLETDYPTWGVNDPKDDPEGKNVRHRTVMLATLWMLYWLGFRRVYIIGADFHMKPEQGYAFDEKVSQGRARSNNLLYRWLNSRFQELIPHFKSRGFEVYNCTVGGNLKHFQRHDFETCVNWERDILPPENRTRGMYR